METFCEQVICKFACLFETIDTFIDLKVNPTIVNKLGEVVFIDKFSRDVINFDAYVFQPIKRCAKVEVGDVETGKACVCGGQDII
jgi:hypothetical protein